MLDFGRLIRDQIPDKDGRTLPLDLASGTYRLRDLTDHAAGGLYEGKVIVDKTYGHAAYSCMVCCGSEFASMEFDPLGVIAGGSGDQSVMAPNSCTGQQNNITGDFPTWWTDNTAIATANKNQIHGVGPGTTNHHAQSIPMYFGFKEYASSCPQSQQKPSAGTNVTPDHLVVQSDTTSVVCTTNQTVRRDITYSEVDANGKNVGTISTEEQFASKGTNTCNTTIQTSETCSPDVGGILTDHIGVGCNSVGGSCGVTFKTQKWLYCPSGGTPVPFATPGDLVIQNNSVTVGGYASFPPGTKISVSGITLP